MTSGTPDPGPSTIGEHYVVDRELGRGGMATVYLCTDRRDDTKVAVKLLREELGSPVVIERFLREIAYASELDHPRIPKVLGSGKVGDLPYYAMTYVDGESLRKRLEREKQLDIDEAVKIACEAISATSYAHKRGIVHRDIKPENILLSETGASVLDFGIARAIVESGGDRLTSTGIGVGTPAYMSPEQALGDRALDARSDIYSLGCVLYEMIGGIPPFVGPTAQVIISRRFAASAPPLREVREGVPNWLEHAIARALAKAPNDRWKTADDFARALAVPGGGSGRITDSELPVWRRPRSRFITAGVALAVLAAGAVAWSMGRRGSVNDAENAIRAWDFPTAVAEFRRVVAANGEDAEAQLALAQAMMLNGDPESDWKPHVLFAGDHREQLSVVDRKRVNGLAAFALDHFGDACKWFDDVARIDRASSPPEYVSTLALADCLRLDPGIIPNKASPSGFSFRASHQRSDSLYEALLDRHARSAPAYAVLMPRLEKVLPMDKRRLRRGVLEGSSPKTFLALPSLVADTIAHVPYEYSPSAGALRTVDPRGLNAAVDKSVQRLRTFSMEWVRIAPNEPDAHETLARILVMTGELSGNDISALHQIGIARRLAGPLGRGTGTDYVRHLRLATGQAGIHIRLGQFAQAAALADTSLKWPVQTSGDASTDRAIATMLDNFAAIVGQPSRVSEIDEKISVRTQVRLGTGEEVALPPALGRDESVLYRYANYGGSRDSVLAIAARVATNVNALVPPGQAEALRSAILRRPLTIAAPVIGPAHVAELGPTSDPYISALAAMASNDRRAARTLLDSVARFRAPNAPSDITMDVVVGEAWLRASLGDTLGAARQLDNALRGLSAAPSSALQSPELTTAMVRAMAFRAVLAGKANQTDIAKRWADAVFDLWGKGDPIVATTLESVRRLR